MIGGYGVHANVNQGRADILGFCPQATLAPDSCFTLYGAKMYQRADWLKGAKPVCVSVGG